MELAAYFLGTLLDPIAWLLTFGLVWVIKRFSSKWKHLLFLCPAFLSLLEVVLGLPSFPLLVPIKVTIVLETTIWVLRRKEPSLSLWQQPLLGLLVSTGVILAALTWQ